MSAIGCQLTTPLAFSFPHNIKITISTITYLNYSCYYLAALRYLADNNILTVSASVSVKTIQLSEAPIRKSIRTLFARILALTQRNKPLSNSAQEIKASPSFTLDSKRTCCLPKPIKPVLRAYFPGLYLRKREN